MEQIEVRQHTERDEVVFPPVVPRRLERTKRATLDASHDSLPDVGLVGYIPQPDELATKAIRALPDVNSWTGYLSRVRHEDGGWRMWSKLPQPLQEIFSKTLQHEIAVNPEVEDWVCQMDVRCVNRKEFLEQQRRSNTSTIHRDMPDTEASAYFVCFKLPTMLATGRAEIASREAIRIPRGKYGSPEIFVESSGEISQHNADAMGISQLVPGALVRFSGDGEHVWHGTPFLDLEDEDMREALEKHWPEHEYRVFVRIIFEPKPRAAGA
jgi:hypothetical protein